MSEDRERKGQGFRPEEMDLSKLSFEELRTLKEAIVARAGRRVGPSDFNPVMMGTQDFTTPWEMYMDPDDLAARWVLLARVIDLSVRRFSLAVLTAAGAVSATQMYSSFGAASMLGVGAAAVWFIVEMVRAPVVKRQ